MPQKHFELALRRISKVARAIQNAVLKSKRDCLLRHALNCNIVSKMPMPAHQRILAVGQGNSITLR
ncbi:hypothetical protein BFW91_27775 [Pseudomonas fluorescens]|jgi:hypothetical protein|nr:hypothetical protein A7D21_29950 [Pseudomonas sp. AP19]OPB02230.1 hypothetical protein BFW91_27775 [Pseudomonas fluorescens]